MNDPRKFRKLTDPEQLLVSSIIMKHLDTEAAKTELATYKIDFFKLVVSERIQVDTNE